MQDLAQRLRTGSIGAFEQLFRELHAPLCEVVDGYVRSQAIAEEIVQDLMFAVWVKRETIVADSLRSYLFAAARNRALHHLRHQSIRHRFAQLAGAIRDVAGVAEAAPLPDADADASERRVALRRAVDQLPPRTRLAIVLQWEHHMSHAEIAIAMGISQKGVEKLLALAKSKLRVSLDAYAD
jgi:RNA polymerase sigma-70 factor (ECF subfamily)